MRSHNESAVQALAATIGSKHGGQSRRVVHLAGGFGTSSVADSTLAVWQKQLALNLTTAALTARAFRLSFADARGTFVFLDRRCTQARPWLTWRLPRRQRVECSTLMRALAEEERVNGVRANALATDNRFAPQPTKKAWAATRATWNGRCCALSWPAVLGRVTTADGTSIALG